MMEGLALRLLLLLALTCTNNSKGCADAASAQQQRACVGNLEPYSTDKHLYTCDGTTLLNASFLEQLDGDLIVSESQLTAVTLPKLRNVTGDG